MLVIRNSVNEDRSRSKAGKRQIFMDVAKHESRLFKAEFFLGASAETSYPVNRDFLPAFTDRYRPLPGKIKQSFFCFLQHWLIQTNLRNFKE